MAEKLTSMDEAEEIAAVLQGAIRECEKLGYDRTQIGSAMAGKGLGLVVSQRGREEAYRVLSVLYSFVDTADTKRSY